MGRVIGNSTKLYRRETADKAIAMLKERITLANASEDFIYWIDKAVVFGSYIDSDEEHLADVNIAIYVTERYDMQTIRKLSVEQSYEANFEGSYLGRMFWAREKLFKYIRNRKVVIALCEGKETDQASQSIRENASVIYANGYEVLYERENVSIQGWGEGDVRNKKYRLTILYTKQYEKYMNKIQKAMESYPVEVIAYDMEEVNQELMQTLLTQPVTVYDTIALIMEQLDADADILRMLIPYYRQGKDRVVTFDLNHIDEEIGNLRSICMNHQLQNACRNQWRNFAKSTEAFKRGRQEEFEPFVAELVKWLYPQGVSIWCGNSKHRWSVLIESNTKEGRKAFAICMNSKENCQYFMAETQEGNPNRVPREAYTKHMGHNAYHALEYIRSVLCQYEMSDEKGVGRFSAHQGKWREEVLDGFMSLKDEINITFSEEYGQMVANGEFIEAREEVLVDVLEEMSPEIFDDGLFQETFKEGKKRRRYSNQSERNPRARKKCLEYWGYRCQACGMQFDEVYGSRGKGYIHVHHHKLVSKQKGEYELNPIEDLIPLCPNCHAMIHIKEDEMSVDELKLLYKQMRQSEAD